MKSLRTFEVFTDGTAGVCRLVSRLDSLSVLCVKSKTTSNIKKERLKKKAFSMKNCIFTPCAIHMYSI